MSTAIQFPTLTVKSGRIIPPIRDTRELWLERGADLITKRILIGHAMPAIRVSIGFTGARNPKKVLGACWSPLAASDNVAQIFIAPSTADSNSILETLLHEMIHALVGLDAGHGKAFKQVAVACGFTGKMTSTVAGPELTERLTAIVEILGPIPHAALDSNLSGKKKQGTRLLKAECAQTGFAVRITQKWIDDAGLPICPCCNESMIIESKEGN